MLTRKEREESKEEDDCGHVVCRVRDDAAKKCLMETGEVVAEFFRDGADWEVVMENVDGRMVEVEREVAVEAVPEGRERGEEVNDGKGGRKIDVNE